MRVRYKNLFAFTGDAALPLMESFVVEDGRIVPDDAPADRDVDLAGGFVTPLFSDQHTHPSYVAQTLSALAALPPDVLRSKTSSKDSSARRMNFPKTPGSKAGATTKVFSRKTALPRATTSTASRRTDPFSCGARTAIRRS